MKAIIYTRFSPRRNADKSESIETQLDYCREYCHSHNYEIAGEFEDRAMSGADENRPGLWNAIDALKRGYVLIAYKLDRLARDVYLSECIRRAVAKRGATIEIVTGCENGDSPEQEMIRKILQVFAEYERKVIAARTKAAMLRHQKQGRRMSDLTPYGWTRDPNNPALMIENETEQTVINQIHDWYAQGDGYREIARKLETQGVPSRTSPRWNGSGAKWHHGTVKRILNRS